MDDDFTVARTVYGPCDNLDVVCGYIERLALQKSSSYTSEQTMGTQISIPMHEFAEQRTHAAGAQ
jgi:hypothetical protein